MIYLDTLKREDMESIVEWRNQNLEGARTSKPLTLEEQLDFYDTEICNRNSRHRYWAIKYEVDGQLLGITGLTYIEWENNRAEISLMIDPDNRQIGYGKEALHVLLGKGFNEMGLQNIYGEVYTCNQSLKFWEKVFKRYNASVALLANTKYWRGYHNSLWFNINIKDYLSAGLDK